MASLIMFFIRRKLHVRTFQYFRFTNQKSSDLYIFISDRLYKKTSYGVFRLSKVSLNWLLDPKCKIVKVGPRL